MADESLSVQVAGVLFAPGALLPPDIQSQAHQYRLNIVKPFNT
jgi:hypothetical protein